MAGKIKKMIEHIISKKSGNDSTLASSLNAKLCLQGVIPKKYDASSPDDPVIIGKLQTIAAEWGVSLAGV
ncbi:hypothetical protein [Methanolobus vulcani]|uniref:Uncharacterized protein n=1 Tax=Methanolobus vulcani TaxID=38026 RepID=A0A7Z8KNL4_9EURY|nr:hypothetical protein [Methanolobus vulcani]TQD25656.1 hypothetical protein FKV42_07080 [Methanolobus vulcani]